jgi:hypothetical protein
MANAGSATNTMRSVTIAPMHQDAESLCGRKIGQKEEREPGGDDEHRSQDGPPHVGKRLCPCVPDIMSSTAHVTNSVTEMKHLVDSQG